MKAITLIILISTVASIQSFSQKVQTTDEVEQYGRLVGKWNCKMKNLVKGEWVDDSAKWEFKYILNGAGIQDFWYNPNESTGKEYYGTNIRVYNPKKKLWECAWIENQNKTINAGWESYQNEEGSMILHDGTGAWEIVFFNIKENTFDWRWDFKQEDGSMLTRFKMTAYREK